MTLTEVSEMDAAQHDRQGISLAVSTVIFALRPHQETGLSTVWLPLVRRIRDPFNGRWALPGGWVTAEESLADAAARNLLETTSLAPTYLEQLYAFGDVDRSPGRRAVSIVYWALVRQDEAERAAEGENVRWFPADELPTLAFDHNVIVEYALWRLRTKMEYSRIARALEVMEATGRSLSDWHREGMAAPVDPRTVAKIFLTCERKELVARIETRFAAMLAAGALDEVRALEQRKLDPLLPAMKAHGVPWLIRHLNGEISLDEAAAGAVMDTRRYAKRQLTWFRNQMKDWPWAAPEEAENVLESQLARV